MQTALGIVTHTPLWVYAILAYLIWQGVQAMATRTQPLWRVLIVPIVFIVMGLSRLAQIHDKGTLPLLVWAVAAIGFAALATAFGPRLLAVDRSKGLITRAGSPALLIRNLTVFIVQYAVAVTTAMHIGGPMIGFIGNAVSGATAGYFLGWAVSLLRHYRQAPAVATA